MDEIINQLKLSNEQRKCILQAISQGKERFEKTNEMIGETITKKHGPFLQYDLINSEVEANLRENPHLNMEVYSKRSGFHPFIVVHDYVKNIFVLVLKLPRNKKIFNPCTFRGEFASANVDRMVEMGLELDELPKDYTHQASLELGELNQPYGIIVSYDGYEDVVYEGSLRPDQEEWLYQEEITEYINLNTSSISHLNQTQTQEEIPLTVKKQEDNIVLKLK